VAFVSQADEVLQRAVDAHQVPGVVALAADATDIIYAGARGVRGVDNPTPMSLDTVVWIASMTKAVTSVAAMQLVEQGRVGLDQAVADVLPALREVQVLEGFDDQGTPRLRPPRRPITLRHLLTHTAGFAYDIWNADQGRYQAHAGLPGIIECKNLTLQSPLMFDPGERWEYGINIDWVGKLVEQLSGQHLEDYFREHIFSPLGMPDTGFIIRPDQRTRLASMHVRADDGSLQAIPFEIPQAPEFYMGGGGLYSTGPDYLRFLRMLLGQGELEGVRILRAETVQAMNQNHIGELTVGPLKTAIPSSSRDFEAFPDMVKKWGLGYMICTEAVPTGRRPGSLAWAGLANTYYWIDPTERITGLILTQILPFGDPIVLDLLGQFEQAIYAARPVGAA
jgi:CubicO group peptidase (beta-lactamase class C family)